MFDNWIFNRRGAIVGAIIGFAIGVLAAMFLVEIQEFLDNACAGSMGWTPLPNKGRAFIVDICYCTPFPTILFALVGGRPWRRKHAYDGI